ncbi:MAG: hypothetical protein ACWA5L_07985 [bacterium]
MAIVSLGACTTTKAMKTTNDVSYVDQNATILIVEPDVQLSLLTAAGLAEPRADWTETGQKNILAEIEAELSKSGHKLRVHEVDVNDARQVQIVKLHEAVGATILLHRYYQVPLPSKKDQFDWSLGPGVQEMATAEDADYALFLFARGSYATAGRQALAVGVAVLAGAYVDTGGQAAYASLVDLNTGDIVWFNVATTSAGTDMRKPEGAKALVKAILKDNPLKSKQAGS